MQKSGGGGEVGRKGNNVLPGFHDKYIYIYIHTVRDKKNKRLDMQFLPLPSCYSKTQWNMTYIRRAGAFMG